MSEGWDSAGAWYDKLVGVRGHYYHSHVILPRVQALLKCERGARPALLDLGCGQGLLARKLPKRYRYVGVDASPALIAAAKKRAGQMPWEFLVHDLNLPLEHECKDFTAAICILSAQHIRDLATLFCSAAHHLVPDGLFVLVLNHPCFRVPRQSSWGFDAAKKWQYRRIDRYMAHLCVPIQTHPSQGEASVHTLSYHYPLSHYAHHLKQAGFAIHDVEEWCSDKESMGKRAKAENQARKEFPLFLTIIARKKALL